MVTLATDGSSLRSLDGENGKGPIAWAWAREDGHWYANGFHIGTNQKAELLALHMALLMHPKESLHIQLDSKYALNIAESWMYGWKRRGWTKADGAEIINLEIVKSIYDLMEARNHKGVEFEWVKGHDKNNANPLNTKADELANTLSNQIKDLLKESMKLDTHYSDSKERADNLVELKYYDKLLKGV
jgi:ribonuclease HI